VSNKTLIFLILAFAAIYYASNNPYVPYPTNLVRFKVRKFAENTVRVRLRIPPITSRPMASNKTRKLQSHFMLEPQLNLNLSERKDRQSLISIEDNLKAGSFDERAYLLFLANDNSIQNKAALTRKFASNLVLDLTQFPCRSWSANNTYQFRFALLFLTNDKRFATIRRSLRNSFEKDSACDEQAKVLQNPAYIPDVSES
jgi:hypothetical protein